LGIEALSRGAKSALLVEADRKACAVMQDNLSRTRLQATVMCQDVFRFLQGPPAAEGADLIFADPPYTKQAGARDFAAELLSHSNLPNFLTTDGTFILEVGRYWDLPETPLWECVRRKKYGSTETLFLRKRRTFSPSVDEPSET
jgi:16S rRNA (guanine966-N2)-methyltransferase